MLVLSRKIGEKVKVGDGIYVTLLNVCDRQAVLGFEAEKDIPVLREELLIRHNMLTADYRG